MARPIPPDPPTIRARSGGFLSGSNLRIMIVYYIHKAWVRGKVMINDR